MDNLLLINESELLKVQEQLNRDRTMLADVKAVYESLKDKRSLLIDEIRIKIKTKLLESGEKATAIDVNGRVLNDSLYNDFQLGFEVQRDKYIRGRIEVSNLETKWETYRTVISGLRKERYNVIK